MKRLLPFGGVLIFLAFLVFSFDFKKTPKVLLPNVEDWADVSLSRVSFVQSENGVKMWELNAEQVQLFENQQTAVLKKISVVVKNENGTPVTLSGDSGKMDMEGKKFLIHQEKQPVTITWGNGYTLKTSELHFASQEKMIASDHEIKISGAGISMRGDGVKMSLDRSEMTIIGNVYAEFH